MKYAPSLRSRLLYLILLPIAALAILLGFWQYRTAQNTAEELFDRSLLSAALAISRDIAISEGDLVLPSTRALITDAAGGVLFYHVTGPGGIYITGYAYPPAERNKANIEKHKPRFYEATYRGERVRVLKITERATIENLSGDTTVTVWQSLRGRQQFAQILAIRTMLLFAILISTLALLVWYGVKIGLRPLTDLQAAIASRSSDDLSIIKRPVPVETAGIVSTLNRLFKEVEHNLNAHQEFISDAAHQLRNPVAAVQSMAEAVRDAPTEEERKKRLNELVSSARSWGRLTDQLLSLDRLRYADRSKALEDVDLNELSEQICRDLGASILEQGIDFEFQRADSPLIVHGDVLFINEAIKNLIDNALKHGGDKLSRITVECSQKEGLAVLTVNDNGVGLSAKDEAIAFNRFSQVTPSDGSGLGLAIVSSVAERHSGSVRINCVAEGASLSFLIPLKEEGIPAG
ncbi:sensor histidine kinase [Rhodobacteraceae bacterium RKSG542]|uniref:sensor histidine kinase n=1 Tax=Pseudovibrio flavus TaxID=2529854 RepID=UPI0012BC9FF9|nr:sensor histidine kinase [Pseudovibrio flavus]MTI18099.1 sensor histidine kinase [Pseudovibrio flavus]